MGVDKELIDKLLAVYKSPEEIVGESGLLKKLTKAIVERALQAELTTHLGYEKPSREGNARNGASGKRLKGEFGTVEIEVPHDRRPGFEPKLVPKGATRFAGSDDKILSLYARGMTTRGAVPSSEEAL